MSNKPILGWVYILTNDAFKEGMIKIGFTNKPTPQERAQELSKHTGVPTEFKVVYAVKVPQAQQVEGKIHQILQHKRARNNREFFECSIAEAVQTIKTVAGKNIVQTMDYRRGQPEKAAAPSPKSPNPKPQNQSRKKTAPPANKKRQKGGCLASILLIIIVFFAAMWLIGWNVERKAQTDQPQPNTAPQEAITTVLPPINNVAAEPVAAAPSWEITRQNMQLAWDKIPDDIQKELQAEQNAWLHKTQQSCQKNTACLTKAYEKRTEYLKGYSIR